MSTGPIIEKTENIELLEEKYRVNDHNGQRHGFSSVRIIQGSLPILIDAPHAVRQIREGKVKVSDAYTGAMTEWLCSYTGTHGCIRCFNNNCDPNYDSTGRGKQYREKLGNYCSKNAIKLIIDLHGTANQEIVCDIGTNEGKNLCGHREYLEMLTEKMAGIGEVLVDGFFHASRVENVSGTMASQYGIPSLQIEVGSRYRKSAEERIAFLTMLEEYIQKISKIL